MTLRFYRLSRRFPGNPTGVPGVADYVYVEQLGPDPDDRLWTFQIVEVRYGYHDKGPPILRAEVYGDSLDAVGVFAAIVQHAAGTGGLQTLDDVERTLSAMGAEDMGFERSPEIDHVADAAERIATEWAKLAALMPDHGVLPAQAALVDRAVADLGARLADAWYYRARDLVTNGEYRARTYDEAVAYTTDPERYGPGPWTIEAARLLREVWAPVYPRA
jgi:hypothetical protein